MLEPMTVSTDDVNGSDMPHTIVLVMRAQAHTHNPALLTNLSVVFFNESGQCVFYTLQLLNGFYHLTAGVFGAQASHSLGKAEYLYTPRVRKNMSVAVSFYKPVDYFSGAFNRFVTWFTSGDYCHCDLVVSTTPQAVMTTVKHIYGAAQKGEYAPEDCQRIIGQIEMAFFDTHFRKAAQTSSEIHLSFSFLWGYPMRVRVMTENAHDTWFKIPTATDTYATLVPVQGVSPEHVDDVLRFAIEGLGKQYDTSGALCSWIPFGESNAQERESYFCSEFVATALQRVHVLDGIPASKTTPNSLYHHMMAAQKNEQ